MRPSDYSAPNSILPIEILADVNTMMDSLRTDMATVLANECTEMGGVWETSTDFPSTDRYMDFYNGTNANEKWGFCRDPNPESP